MQTICAANQCSRTTAWYATGCSCHEGNRPLCRFHVRSWKNDSLQGRRRHGWTSQCKSESGKRGTTSGRAGVRRTKQSSRQVKRVLPWKARSREQFVARALGHVVHELVAGHDGATSSHRLSSVDRRKQSRGSAVNAWLYSALPNPSAWDQSFVRLQCDATNLGACAPASDLEELGARGPARAELKRARSKLHEQGTAPHRSMGGGGHLSRSPNKCEFCRSCGAGRGADGGSNRGARHGSRGTAPHRFARQWRALATPALHDDGACVWDRLSNELVAD